MFANKREERTEAYAGDIVGIVGLKNARTGDTLSDPQAPILYEAVTFPKPVITRAIEPRTKADQEQLFNGLYKLAEEDPTFVVKQDQESGQTHISGMGELHLEILIDRLIREFNVQANIGNPQVAYKEGLSSPSSAEGKFIRQSGGHGQYGHVVIEIEPQPLGTGFEFINKIVGGAIPKEFIPAVKKGFRTPWAPVL